jgi:hypothetical protein
MPLASPDAFMSNLQIFCGAIKKYKSVRKNSARA